MSCPLNSIKFLMNGILNIKSVMVPILLFISLIQSTVSDEWPKNYELQDGDQFDFIVVGAGSAGAIVAARLSEISRWSVLLIEAGGDPPIASVIPSLMTSLQHTAYDWDYKAQLDKGIGQAHPNGTVFMARGKGLGGSSLINYELYVRGVPRDYDDWNDIAPGWDWNTALYYFKKLEGMTDTSVFQNPENAALHSRKGPVLVSRPLLNQKFAEKTNVYLDSLQEIGIKRILESNGPDVLGACQPHSNFANGRRSSTAEAYLKPIRKRKNLHIAKYSRVSKVLFDMERKQTKGAEVILQSGKTVKVYSEKEVIISAGAIDSPKILMLSGIGPKQELEKLSIDVVMDLPAGENLQDHLMVNMIFIGKKGFDTFSQNMYALTDLDAYPLPVQVGFFDVDNSTQSPQFQLFNMHIGAGSTPMVKMFCKSVVNFDNAFCSSVGAANLLHELDMTQVVMMNPKSRGQIFLKSKDPLVDPIIELGYFRDESDMNLTAKGVKFMSRLVNATYYSENQGKLANLDIKGCEGEDFGTDSYWRCYVKNVVTTLMHPVGTCAMGPDGVVDETLKVHGVKGLRVVDASIMPKIPSGNTNAPAMMVGERGADLIKEEYGIVSECTDNV